MHNLRRGLIFLFLVSFVIVIAPPPGVACEDEVCEDSSGFNLGAWLASIYRDHISAVDADRCPSIPSCSSYAVQAFQKHGLFIGWMMTVDRLIHEGEEAAVSPLVYSDGKWKIFDPVENNDFWWYSQDRKHHE